MTTNFEKFAQEGNSFMKELARNLGHPNEIGRTEIILRAVLHTLRDRLTVGESLNLISSLPMFMKAMYVDSWKYRDKPLPLKTRQDFIDEVERLQLEIGERNFDWAVSTEEIVNTVFNTMKKYIPEGEVTDMVSQLPADIRELFREKIHH
jgi:uncharacterized protein (DUF2267 family)